MKKILKPTKRVGKIYSKEEADTLIADKGWIFKESKADGGWKELCHPKANACNERRGG